MSVSLNKGLNYTKFLSNPKSKPGVPKLPLAMYPFSILTNEHVPLKFLMANKVRKIQISI